MFNGCTNGENPNQNLVFLKVVADSFLKPSS